MVILWKLTPMPMEELILMMMFILSPLKVDYGLKKMYLILKSQDLSIIQINLI